MRLLYPGSFDPITKGHIDIIWRASGMCTKLIVAIGNNEVKVPYLTAEQRKILIERDVNNFTDEKRIKRIKVVIMEGLTMQYAMENGCDAIVRGIRNGRDADSEINMWHVGTKSLWPIAMDEILLPCKQDYTHISSSAVKALLFAGAEESQLWKFVTPDTAKFLVEWRDTQAERIRKQMLGEKQVVPC